MKKLIEIQLAPDTAQKDIKELKELFEKKGKGEYINKVLALNQKFDYKTTLADFPANVQDDIRADVKERLEPQIKVQKKLNPNGLQAYLEAELQKAISNMQDMIQESKKEGAVIYNINEIYVYNQERAKLLQKYLNEIEPIKTKEKPNPLLSNQQFQKVLQRAIQEGFVEVEKNNVYRWKKSIGRLAVFADVLNAQKIVSTKFSEIENLFNKKNLGQEFNRVWGQTNKEEIYEEIKTLFE